MHSDGIDALSSGVPFIDPSTPIVVFSDVDGVFRSVHTPLLATAAGALERLMAEDVAVVLCSSHTRAELELIRQKLGIVDPFVCENGSAVLIPPGYFAFDVPGGREVAGYRAVEFGRPYTDVVATLRRTADRLGVRVLGFSDMSIQDVARECGLTLLRARLAKLREYEEPFRILDSDSGASARLFKALHAARLRCVQGVGDFHHVGAPVDGTVGVSLLTSLYRRAYEGSVATVGITDPQRDENLMALVDHALLVRDADATAGALDIADWAAGIADTVREQRRILKRRVAGVSDAPRS